MLFVLIGAVCFSLTGCKRKASQAECEAMADRNVTFLKDDPAFKPGSDTGPLRESIVEACRANGMTAELAHCVIDAPTAQEAVACQLKYSN
jgi:hypothetical protein